VEKYPYVGIAEYYMEGRLRTTIAILTEENKGFLLYTNDTRISILTNTVWNENAFDRYYGKLEDVYKKEKP
jgi:hypothetical protein